MVCPLSPIRLEALRILRSLYALGDKQRLELDCARSLDLTFIADLEA